MQMWGFLISLENTLFQETKSQSLQGNKDC